jgi:hypothetical protein
MTVPRIDGVDYHAGYNPVTDRQAVPPLRLLSVKASEGVYYAPDWFVTEITWMRGLGTEVCGAYHWIRPDNIPRQVDNFLRQLDRVGGIAPGIVVQLDWEFTAGLRWVAVDEVDEWIAGVEAEVGPNRVIVYASDWVQGFPEWRKANPGREVWYANYNLSDKPTGGAAECAQYDAIVWQWTSRAAVPGFGSLVDANEVLSWDRLRTVAGLDIAPPPPPPPPPPPAPSDTEVIVISLPIVRPGDRGEPVESVQGLLVARGFGVKIDGIYGEQTRYAVETFQARNGLTKDGIVGTKQTWPALLLVAV